jgi:hypothetical protein
MPKKKYLTVSHKLTSIDDCYFEGDICAVINVLQGLVEDFKDKEYEKLYLEKDTSFGYYNEVEVEYVLYGIRRETESEYVARMEKNKKVRQTIKENKKKKLEEEKKEYERLKKKFEGK